MSTKKISDLTTIAPLGTDLVVLDRPNTGPSAPITGQSTLAAAVAAVSPEVTGTFNVPQPGDFVTTASVALAGGEGFSYTADSVGSDTYFFVSGALGSKDGSVPGVASFGGDVVISGTLHGGSPLKIGTDVQVTGTISLGAFSEVVGAFSLAGGLGLVASGSSQAVFGRYNSQNNSDSLLVVGNGYTQGGEVPGSPNAIRQDVLRVNRSPQPNPLNPPTGPGTVEVTGTLSVTQGISGSLTRLVDGSSYLIAGGGVDIVTGSTGQVTVSATGPATGKQYVAPYTSVNNVTGTVVGQFSWFPSDYSNLSSIVVRTVLSTDGSTNLTGSLQIYNFTSGTYVDLIDTPTPSKFMEITSSNPTVVTSSNLLSGETAFGNLVDSVYEVRVSGSISSQFFVGGVELVFN